jgi:DnaK suppressor protein
MSQQQRQHPLTAAQLAELKALLLKRHEELQQEMQQNRESLAPPTSDEGAMVQRNATWLAKRTRP